MITSKKELLKYVADYGAVDAIVVEGFDGVGKGYVLEFLSNMLHIVPYRPDYNLWNSHDHRICDRWKISGFFWDVYSHFQKGHRWSQAPMLFDRGVISGAVYNNDINIAKDYSKMIRGMRLLHILVTCSEEDYVAFSKIRNSQSELEDYSVCEEYTKKYIESLEVSGVDYIIYKNCFSEDECERLRGTCSGCGHYSYGFCRHPIRNCRVDGYHPRCEYSTEKEVQDIDGNEVYSLCTE